ncbi:hypothetical protein ACI3L1_14620 [Deinococcus sp. SM5_A1]|uniref:hypothetical protein n=1 Tax=Deinococcus sp. SM5_A1 TaxID=3379094 RepID=UPI00385DD42F
MAYSFAVWCGEAPEFAEQADDFFSSFEVKQEGLPPSPILQSLVADLLVEYPEHDIDDNDFDDDAWIWTDAPLMGNVVGDCAVLSVAFSKVDSVMPNILEIIGRHNVHFIDWQQKVFIRSSFASP